MSAEGLASPGRLHEALSLQTHDDPVGLARCACRLAGKIRDGPLPGGVAKKALHDAHSHDAYPRGARDAATGRRPLRFDVEQQAGKINVDGSRAVGVRKPGGL